MRSQKFARHRCPIPAVAQDGDGTDAEVIDPGVRLLKGNIKGTGHVTRRVLARRANVDKLKRAVGLDELRQLFYCYGLFHMY